MSPTYISLPFSKGFPFFKSEPFKGAKKTPCFFSVAVYNLTRRINLFQPASLPKIIRPERPAELRPRWMDFLLPRLGKDLPGVKPEGRFFGTPEGWYCKRDPIHTIPIPFIRIYM